MGWNGLDVIPPDEIVDVIDKDGNINIGQPTYYPFRLEKKNSDERKPWGFRATPVFYEDGVCRWDGGWLIYGNLTTLTRDFGTVVGWRKQIEHENVTNPDE